MSQTAPLNADLHCHSIISDGTLSPEELALRAHQNGVQVWSLTDHDVLGGQERARLAAENLGMTYLSGVEISISGRGLRARQMAAQLEQVGIQNSYEGALHFAGNPELIARTHFARFLVEQKICSNMDEVFRKYLIAGKPGYVSHRWASLDEAVSWIRGAGGEAVIAHPGRYKLNTMQMDELYARFKDLGGSGIEVVTGSHSPDQYKTYAKIAERYGFMASRGSDFHDPHESNIDLGLLPHLPEHLKPIWSVFH